MAFDIISSPEAVEHLSELPARNCRIILDESVVAVIAVGMKQHDKLLIAGEEIEL